MRYLVGFMFVLALGTMGCGETSAVAVELAASEATAVLLAAASAVQVVPQGSVTTALKPLTTQRHARRAPSVRSRGRASSATRSRVRTSSVAPWAAPLSNVLLAASISTHTAPTSPGEQSSAPCATRAQTIAVSPPTQTGVTRAS